MPLLEADDPNDELLDVCGELNEVWSKMTLKCLDAIEKSKGIFSKMFQETKFEVEVNNMLNEVFQKHPNFQKYQTAAKAYIALTQMLVDTIENDTGKEKGNRSVVYRRRGKETGFKTGRVRSGQTLKPGIGKRNRLRG